MISSVQIRNGNSAMKLRAGSVIPHTGNEDLYIGISNSKGAFDQEAEHSSRRTVSEISSWSSRSQRNYSYSVASSELKMNGEHQSLFRKRDNKSLHSQILYDVHRKNNNPVRKSLSVLGRQKEKERDGALYMRKPITRPDSVSSESQGSESLQCDGFSESNSFFQRSIAMRVLRAASAFKDSPIDTSLEVISGNGKEGWARSCRDIKSAVVRSRDKSLNVNIQGWQSNLVLGSVDSGIDSLEPLSNTRPGRANKLSAASITRENAEEISKVRIANQEMNLDNAHATENVENMDEDSVKSSINSHLSANELKSTSDPITKQGNPTDEDTNDAMEEPEYLDSFCDIAPLSPRRPSLWYKLRGLGARPLTYRALNSDTNSVASYSSSNSKWFPSSPRSNSSSGKKTKEERCPNCNEVLQRAPLRFFAGKRHEQAILTWIFSKWKPVRNVYSVLYSQGWERVEKGYNETVLNSWFSLGSKVEVPVKLSSSIVFEPDI